MRVDFNRARCMVLAGAILTLACAGSQAASEAADSGAEAPAPTAVDHAAKLEQFLEGRIPVGFYTYIYTWKQYRDPEAHDLDDAIGEMAKRGFTYLYVGGVSDTLSWRRVLELCEQYRMAVLPQLDFVYFRDKANVDRLVPRAAAFIRKYKDHPAVMAFSVKEEPWSRHMPGLTQYYDGILREVPDARLHLLHNQLPPLAEQQPPYPQIIGTDRYGFWWEMSGHRATPWYALDWTHSQLAAYYKRATDYGAEFQAVFTGCVSEDFTTPERLRKQHYGDGAQTEEGRDAFVRKVQDLAEREHQGWAKVSDEKLRFWKYYRPPVNCVRAMSWLSIMEGARSVGVYYWMSAGKREQAIARCRNADRRYEVHMKGWDGQGTPQLEEYTEFAAEVQRYARLIRSMTKITGAGPDTLPLGHELVANTNGARNIVEVAGDQVAWQAFTVPGYTGQVVLVVNKAVGAWCDGRSPKYLSPSDEFRIDKDGELVDYKPFTEPRRLTCRVLPEGLDAFDLVTGMPLEQGDDRTLTLSATPGGPAWLFLTPAGSEEWPRLREAFGL